MSDRSLPNLIIAGVSRAGTTSLFTYLSCHPDICGSSRKETNYFSPLRFGKDLPPIDQYLQYFGHCSVQKYIMEASPAYIYGGSAIAQAIQNQLGDVKIIFSLRDPVRRSFSFYRYRKSRMEIDQRISFDDYIRICESLQPDDKRNPEFTKYWGIEGGFYIDYLAQWFDVFGESVRIVFLERLKDDPFSVLRELCEWLRIDHTVFDDSLQLSIHNISVSYKNPTLQRVAVRVNKQGEMFWRSHPRIKRILRSMYYAINERPAEETMSDDAVAYLESLFSLHNIRLATQLSKRGYTNLPYWMVLDDEEKTAGGQRPRTSWVQR